MALPPISFVQPRRPVAATLHLQALFAEQSDKISSNRSSAHADCRGEDPRAVGDILGDCHTAVALEQLHNRFELRPVVFEMSILASLRGRPQSSTVWEEGEVYSLDLMLLGSGRESEGKCGER